MSISSALGGARSPVSWDSQLNHYNRDPASFNYTAFYSQPCFAALEKAEAGKDHDVDKQAIVQQCSDVSLVFYSKDESQNLQFDKYHWLITEAPSR